jgi:hypothetical protein
MVTGLQVGNTRKRDDRASFDRVAAPALLVGSVRALLLNRVTVGYR